MLVQSGHKEKVEYTEIFDGKPVTCYREELVCGCGDRDTVEDRYSLGCYAGKFCDSCWDLSGYRKEGKEGFDPAYAGEYYDDDY